MKELSIEEKAKAYDEAKEKAKIWQEHLYDVNDKDYADELNYIFPALKESEDERMFKECSIAISASEMHTLDEKRKMEIWLKSLKNRYTWKPSDEQMKALYDSIPEMVMVISEREMLLNSLYKDLKKLCE